VAYTGSGPSATNRYADIPREIQTVPSKILETGPIESVARFGIGGVPRVHRNRRLDKI
jgi:hypothetical protein